MTTKTSVISIRAWTVSVLSLLLGIFLYAANSAAQPVKSNAHEDKTCTNGSELEKILPADLQSVTTHKLQAGKIELDYQTTAGTLPVKLGKNGPECRIFFIGYHVLNKGQTPQPLTFVFNGGPGASSAYLHLGALGPKRVVLNKKESPPASPPVAAQLIDNLETWLRFTDIVFVDPAGTGYSRCTQIEGKKEAKNGESRAWGVREDLASLAEFIRLYLTRNNRWLSPKFLVGESYGGFRAAALSDLLLSRYDISVNGIVLVSPALEFELVEGNEFSLLPWVARLPSYAATARQHGKATGEAVNTPDKRKALQDAEHFAVQEFLPALAGAESSGLLPNLAGFIGLPAERLARLNARVTPDVFSKELLRDTGRVLSVLDGSFTTIDPDPASPFPPREDPMLARLNPLLAAAFNSYIRQQLQFETDIPYEILNSEAASRWNWRSGMQEAQGFVGVTQNLKNSMSINKQFKVLIAHGVFDLITPYFGSVLVTRQMSLDPAVAANLQIKVYDGGHMFYTSPESRKKFFEDAEYFFSTGDIAAKAQ